MNLKGALKRAITKSKKSKARYFRLRNGITVVENLNHPACLRYRGYTDEYLIVSSLFQGYRKGSEITLAFSTRDNPLPIGNYYGEGFDIIKKITKKEARRG